MSTSKSIFFEKLSSWKSIILESYFFKFLSRCNNEHLHLQLMQNIQLVTKKFGMKRENRKYLVSGPWCQSRGPLLDNVSFLKKSKCFISLELNFCYLFYLTSPYSVLFCAKKSNISPLNLT